MSGSLTIWGDGAVYSGGAENPARYARGSGAAFFPLDMSPVAPREEGQRGGDAIVLRSKSGIEIHLQSDDVKALGQSYLLTLPEETKDAFSLAQLRLNWDSQAGNWQESLGLCKQ